RLLTAVAVPATTAVRAMPPMSPITNSFSGLESVERGDDRLGRDVDLSDELTAGLPGGEGKRERPQVLVDDEEAEACRLKRRRSRGGIVVRAQVRCAHAQTTHTGH